MKPMLQILSCSLLILAGQIAVSAQSRTFDVIHYDAQVEPDIAAKSVRGRVTVLFSTAQVTTEIELDSGFLTIDSVREANEALKFSTANKHLTISLPASSKAKREIVVDYHGTPRWGINFFPDRNQIYSVFSTSQWLPCVDAPEDRATLRMKLVLPKDLTVVSNGSFVRSTSNREGKVVHEWLQDKPIPTYTFGFAAGPFNVIRDGAQLRYLSASSYTADEVRRIFRDTRDMIEFYEERSGVPYADKTYTQVLAAGNVAQEMSSFTAIEETYGKKVLANERDVWLGAHELAHQWWGNMITCRDWNHFWLNEGIASFMAAAYLEHRYGREEYLKEIEKYRASYEAVKAKKKDKSLVFPNWDSPTRDDRALVYDKGAYVTHLLREDLGEKRFWAGLRLYTRRHWLKSVTTPDFQKAMEEGSGQKLDAFFQKWVY
jgi:aminopeptidase N